MQKLCSKALLDLYEFNAQLLDWKTKILLFYGPLFENLNTKTEPNLLNCTAMCLFELSRTINYENNKEIFDCLNKEIPLLIVKIKMY